MAKTIRTAARSATRAEFRLTRLFRDQEHSLPVRALAVASEVGDQPQLRAICAGMIAAGLVGDPRLLRAGARMLLAHELATAVKRAIKRRIDRRRPRSAASARHGEPHPGHSRAKEESSFPSGHTAGAVAVARAFGREFPEYRTAAHSVAELIGVAQIPRCAHYPTDVGAGAMIGLVAEGAVDLAWNALVDSAGDPQNTGLPSTFPGGE